MTRLGGFPHAGQGPSGAKARELSRLVGTAEAVPFPKHVCSAAGRDEEKD
jgi:hypothetical protein